MNLPIINADASISFRRHALRMNATWSGLSPMACAFAAAAVHESSSSSVSWDFLTITSSPSLTSNISLYATDQLHVPTPTVVTVAVVAVGKLKMKSRNVLVGTV